MTKRMFPGLTAAFLMVFVLRLLVSARGQLQMDYYAKSCPKAEKLVQDYVHKHIPHSPNLAAALLRKYFHDCFVMGCNGSVLINSTSNHQAEKAAVPNLTVKGFDFIDRVKNIVEAECLGTVSCADIIARGGPSWRVPTGRRDGVVSRASEALNNIPPPTSNFTTLQTLFTNQGLIVKDLVVLSGAHTIGVTNCSSFSSSLYNFTGKGDQDPSLDPKCTAIIKGSCKILNDNTTVVEVDPGSFKIFDLAFYSLLLKRRGIRQSDVVVQSDAVPTTNTASKAYVTQLLEGSHEDFYAEFALAMEKMGKKDQREDGSARVIRKRCALIN